jgi:alcohol dehydrogenase
MHASGICYTDVHQTLGHLPGPFPGILGHEPVGEIVAVAPDVTTRKVGDRVGTAWIQSTCGRCEWCQRGRRMFCPYLKGTGTEAQGGHAEYMLMNADATWRRIALFSRKTQPVRRCRLKSELRLASPRVNSFQYRTCPSAE